MTSVLVVDDSAVDRKLTASLITKDTDWQVDVCENGDVALTRIEENLPDLVISDLRMPKVDGFELITNLKKRYPAIPVIIITSKGSEELALDALRNGAASYCPKVRMSTDLVDIANSVLSVQYKQKKSEQVLSKITSSSFSFKFENDSSLIPPMIEHIQSHMVGWNETDRLRVGVALDESLLNAMHHGNLEVDSRLRDEGDGEEYRCEIQKRLKEAPFCQRKICLEAQISSSEIQVRVRDEGPGFEPSEVPDPTTPENLEKPSGRGLLLIRSFMTQVLHNTVGNEITMIKKREV